MSAGTATVMAAGAAAPRRGLVIALIAGLGLLGGGGAAAYFWLPDAGSTEATDTIAPAAAPSDESSNKASFVEMPDVLVNLVTDQARARYLKLKLTLEVESDVVARQISGLTPRVMDSFQAYLRALRPEDLHGPGAMQTLKDELLARVNFAIGPLRVEEVLVKEMLVQ
jgi:flagellar protein FliL